MTKTLSAWFFLDESDGIVGPYKSEAIALEEAVYYNKYLNNTLTPIDKQHIILVSQEHIYLFQAIKAHFAAYSENGVDNPKFSGYFFVSFADSKLPEGKQFLGAAVVAGSSAEEAILNCHSKKINPGGDAVALPIPLVAGNEQYELHMLNINKLMIKAELIEKGFNIIRVPPIEKAATN